MINIWKMLIGKQCDEEFRLLPVDQQSSWNWDWHWTSWWSWKLPEYTYSDRIIGPRL